MHVLNYDLMLQMKHHLVEMIAQSLIGKSLMILSGQNWFPEPVQSFDLYLLFQLHNSSILWYQRCWLLLVERVKPGTTLPPQIWLRKKTPLKITSVCVNSNCVSSLSVHLLSNQIVFHCLQQDELAFHFINKLPKHAIPEKSLEQKDYSWQLKSDWF